MTGPSVFSETEISTIKNREMAKYCIGSEKYAVIGICNDIPYFNLYHETADVETGKDVGARKLISLNTSRLAVLMYNIMEICSAVDKLSSDYPEYVDFSCHLGGGIFISIKSEYQHINMSRYYMPEGKTTLVPTEDVVLLDTCEWYRLTEAIEHGKELINDFKYALPCSFQGCYYNQHHSINCFECQPFGDILYVVS